MARRADVVDALRELFLDLMQMRARLGPDPWFAHDLTMAQFRALLLLHQQGGDGIRVGAVVQALGRSPNATTSLLDRMAAAGLIVRELDPADRRAWRVTITEAGTALVNELTSAGTADLLDYLGRLTLPELEALHLGMGALHRALGERIDEQASNNDASNNDASNNDASNTGASTDASR